MPSVFFHLFDTAISVTGAEKTLNLKIREPIRFFQVFFLTNLHSYDGNQSLLIQKVGA